MGGRNHDHQTTNRLDSRWTTWVPRRLACRRSTHSGITKAFVFILGVFQIGGWTNTNCHTKKTCGNHVHMNLEKLYLVDPSWWLNQPIWKICASQIGSWNPRVRDENKKYLSCHLPVKDSPVFFSPLKNGYVWNCRRFRKLQKKSPCYETYGTSRNSLQWECL